MPTQATIATIERLEKANWFINVGQSLVLDPQVTDKVITCKSWKEAMQHSSKLSWENIQLEAANSLRAKIIKADPKRFHVWNDKVIALKPTAFQMIDQKSSFVIQQNNLPEGFKHTVQWDILHLLMEAEYSDIVKPTFFAAQAYWYVTGRFPCGWKGKFPEGQLIVF